MGRFEPVCCNRPMIAIARRLALYRCPVCGGWHINTAADREQRLERRWRRDRCARRGDDEDTTPWRADALRSGGRASARQAQGGH
jgi:hypothetical protein